MAVTSSTTIDFFRGSFQGYLSVITGMQQTEKRVVKTTLYKSVWSRLEDSLWKPAVGCTRPMIRDMLRLYEGWYKERRVVITLSLE